MVSEHARLTQEYGGALPPGLAGLAASDADHLAGAIEAARAKQGAALRAATDSGLDFIPRILRVPVKKVLFG